MSSRVPDTALVIRGGVRRDVQTIINNVNDAIVDIENAVISVQASSPLEGEARDDTIMRICETAYIPNNQVQESTAEAIRSAGFEIVSDTTNGQAETHCHVVFQQPVRESDAQRFIDSFSEPFLRPKRHS